MKQLRYLIPLIVLSSFLLLTAACGSSAIKNDGSTIKDNSEVYIPDEDGSVQGSNNEPIP